LIAIVGLYVAIDSLGKLSRELIEIIYLSWYSRSSLYFEAHKIRLIISGICYVLIFILGGLIFCFPEKLVNFRDEIIKKYFKKNETEND
jgi:hypothetical protein